MSSTAPLVFAIFLVVAVYLEYPPPPFSSSLVDWTGRGEFAVLRNEKIFYIDHTNEDFVEDVALLMLHGFPTSSFDWHKIWPNLTTYFHRVITFDFLGYGLSEKPFRRRLYSIKSQADLVLKLLRLLNVSKVHLLSHDMGDTVVQELLYRNSTYYLKRLNNGSSAVPVIIKSVCMLNGGIFEGVYHPRIIQKVLAVPFLGHLICPFLNFQIFRIAISETFGTKNPPSERDLKDLYALIVFRGGHLIIPELLQYLEQRRLNALRWKEALQHTFVPVHFIYGPADPINPPAFVPHFKYTLPKASIQALDSDVGHYPQLEDPEGVTRSYIAFVSDLVDRDTNFVSAVK